MAVLLIVSYVLIVLAVEVLCHVQGWNQYWGAYGVLVCDIKGDEASPSYRFTNTRLFCLWRWMMTLVMLLIAMQTWWLPIWWSQYQSSVVWPIMMGAVFIVVMALFAYAGVTNGAAMHWHFRKELPSRLELNENVTIIIFDNSEKKVAKRMHQRLLGWLWHYRHWHEKPVFEGTLNELIDELYFLQERHALLERREAAALVFDPDPLEDLEGSALARRLSDAQDLASVRQEIESKRAIVKGVYALFDRVSAVI